MIAAVLLVGATGLASTASVSASDLAGLWHTPADGGSIVRLTPCDADGICGRIVTSPHIRATPDQKDIRNRDLTQRSRTLRDLMILKVRAIGPGRWGDGWVYNPEDGGTYRGVMALQPDGTLRLTGCIVQPFCKTQTWRRATAD
jgi:uncharacterized protein (DUF2147 family)